MAQGEIKDVDPKSAESLFDVVVNRRDGVREGLIMVGERPVFIVLSEDMTRSEAEEIIEMARMMVESANTLPI